MRDEPQAADAEFNAMTIGSGYSHLNDPETLEHQRLLIAVHNAQRLLDEAERNLRVFYSQNEPFGDTLGNIHYRTKDA